VRLLPPTKASRTMKPGDFVRARVVACEGHDLVALPL
jgi:ribosomal protein S12 methylthiotransferase